MIQERMKRVSPIKSCVFKCKVNPRSSLWLAILFICAFSFTRDNNQNKVLISDLSYAIPSNVFKFLTVYVLSLLYFYVLGYLTLLYVSMYLLLWQINTNLVILKMSFLCCVFKVGVVCLIIHKLS